MVSCIDNATEPSRRSSALEGGPSLGIVAASSAEFVTRAFECLESGRTFVALRSEDDQQRIRMGQVGEVIAPRPGGGWVDARLSLPADDTLAQIAFTSGTEGQPKAVGLSRANLSDVMTRLTAVMHTTAEIREYVGVPVYHSFGFGRCRAVAAVGGKVFLPSGAWNPIEIEQMLQDGTINAISAVPSLWRLLLQSDAVSARAAARVRWIEIGSQTLSRVEKEAMRARFPEAVIVQHYGLTEASRSTFLEVHAVSGAMLDSVGRATGEVELGIGDDGRIRIRGPHVTRQLFEADEEGVCARDPRDADGFLTTSDLGELRDGYLFHLGRADDVINMGGLKLAPDMLEARIREVLGQPAELAVCRVPDALRGDGILIALTEQCAASDAQLLEAAVEAAQELGVHARGALHVLRVDTLQRTETGKVQRRALAQRYLELRGAQPMAAPSAAASADSSSLREALRAIVAAPEVEDADTFTSLGGDSLGYIQAALVIQRRLGHLPLGWENLSMAELDAQPVLDSQQDSTAAARGARRVVIEASVLLRALAIFGIVVNHSHILENVLAIDGGAHLLLIPSGYSFARFQLQRVVASDSAGPALGTFPRIFVPALLFTVLLQLSVRKFTLSTLLFYSNWTDPHAGNDRSFWFINVLLQLYLVAFALCSVPSFRRKLRETPLALSAGVLAVASLTCALGPRVWNTEYLYNLLPHMFAWLFFGGAALYFAQETHQPNWRVLASVALVGLSALLSPGLSVDVWVMLGGLFMIWSPRITVPRLLAQTLSVLASASLYIYLTHWTSFHLVHTFFPRAGAPLQIVTALALGSVAWRGFNWMWDGLARLRRTGRGRRPA